MSLSDIVRHYYQNLGYSLNKSIHLVGKKLFFAYLGVALSTWIVILCVVLSKHGHINSTQQIQSTTNAKLTMSIFTNFTKEDFNLEYVKPEEMPLYNRVWIPEDIVLVNDMDRMEVMTNLVITANQKRSTCPDSPLIAGALCDHKQNHCKKGRQMKLGVQTGRCVPADFPYHNTTSDQWVYGNTCEIHSWCPVNRMSLPLKNYRAVLADTRNCKIWLENTIEFPEYDISVDNLANSEMEYYIGCNRTRDANCPIFQMGDIIGQTENIQKSNYDKIAKMGAIINFNIDWTCWLPFTTQFTRENCQLKYSWHRIDSERTTEVFGYRSFRKTFHYKDGSRTYWSAATIRFNFNVNAKLSWLSVWKLMFMMGAFSAYFHVFIKLFEIIVRYHYSNQIHDNYVHLEENDDSTEILPIVDQSPNEQDINGETN